MGPPGQSNTSDKSTLRAMPEASRSLVLKLISHPKQLSLVSFPCVLNGCGPKGRVANNLPLTIK